MQIPLSLKLIYTVRLVHLLPQYNTLYIVPGDGDKLIWRCSFLWEIGQNWNLRMVCCSVLQKLSVHIAYAYSLLVILTYLKSNHYW